ncbi:MAG TPA: penicillin-binding transpeptidase domain-containing protein, partial [Clostridiales bacterium]|nr:penicillin-binding transpeptidase domain-containing protein [Clostridiales bacterium]
LGQTWLDGFTVQSAIGQSSNLVTPIQLANYCAVIANGGTLYQPHFVKTVKTFDYSQTVLEKERVVKWETGFSKNTLDIVREGMFLLGTDGYMKSRYANVPVNVGVKTGTSQVYRNVNGVSKKQNNVFIICYAPAEKPEIAIATVAEGFRSSAASGVISAGILEAYFADSSVSETVQFENVLLG